LASVAAGYLPILLFLIVALGLSTAFVVLPMIVSRFTPARTSPIRPNSANMNAAFPAFDDARAEFGRALLSGRDPVHRSSTSKRGRFLFPWAVSLNFTKWTGWAAMMVFLLELGFGLAYAWKKGALEWE